MTTQKSFLTKLGELIDQQRAEQHITSPSGAARPHPVLRLLRWFIPNGGTLLIAAVLIFTQRVWAQGSMAPTSAPGPSATTVNYQGRLANSGGAPLTGNYGMTFTIWDAASGGNSIWGPESHDAVPVSSGLFSVGLGSRTSGGIPPTVWNGDRYLEITVGGETLSPRELIRSVPIAGMALTVPDGSITTVKIADGAITSVKLGVSLPRFLGHKTCDNCGTPTETPPSSSAFVSVKGANNQDRIEVTATTQGGAVVVHMTSRVLRNPAGIPWCGIEVLQGNTSFRFAHIDGNRLAATDTTCSGSYVFADLPAGTYTFRAMAWVDSGATAQWVHQRQIAVFEYY